MIKKNLVISVQSSNLIEKILEKMSDIYTTSLLIIISLILAFKQMV